MEQATTGSAAVVVLAETVNSHHFTLEYRVGIQTLACPFSAGGTLVQASRNATRLHAGQAEVFVRSCVVPALGEVAMEVSAGPVPLLDVCSQELPTYLQFVVVSELDAKAQLAKHGMGSVWNCIRTGLRPVNLVVNTIIRAEDETGRQLVGRYLSLGYVTQQLPIEGSGQNRQMVERRNDT